MTDRRQVPPKSDAAPPRRRRVPRWLLEIGVILASVALGYAAARFEEYQSNRGLAEQALAALVGEIEHNHDQLRPMISFHAGWVSGLEAAQRSTTESETGAALDLWFAARPDLPAGARAPFPLLQRSAWDAALSSGALRFIEYDVATALAELYRMQEIATDNIDRLAHGALSDVATYDPASRRAAVRLLWLTLADILSAEVMLLDLYEVHMTTVQAAAGRRSTPTAPGQ